MTKTVSDMVNLCRRSVFVMMMSLLLVAGTVEAVEIGNLYVAHVPVTGQGVRERTLAVTQAFSDVLVRVSGSRKVLEIEGVSKVLAQSMQYVRQYDYQALADELVVSGDDMGDEGVDDAALYDQQLEVVFDELHVNEALRTLGAPIWGKARPVTLVWLAVEEWDSRLMMGADNMPLQLNQLQDAALLRGLPLMFPMQDLEDQMALRFSDVWGDFQEAIVRASDRYAPGAVLTGRLYRLSDEEWEARWSFYQDGQWSQWITTSRLQGDVLRGGVEMAADQLAERLSSVMTVGQGDLLVRVEQVDSLARYAKVMKYFSALDKVSSVQLDHVNGDVLTFHLSVRGDQASFVNSIVFGETLAPVRTAVLPADNQAAVADRHTPGLTYRLLR